jgi:drug/metabolite transporter superfamily protein YnfA
VAPVGAGIPFFPEKAGKKHSFIFIGAAVLEVAGDAVVRKGLRGGGVVTILGGCLMLGLYGLVVNLIQWDFAKLLGIYVSVFAVISFFFGWIIFKETIPVPTWVGLGFIVTGGLIIQFGDKLFLDAKL